MAFGDDVRIGAVILSLALPLAACSSVSKSSELISSPITSLVRSSSPEAAYREDVRDFTAAHLQSGGNVDQLRREIGSLAARHGISDWEHNESTYRGIGAGLAKAGYRQLQVDAFKANITDTPEQAEWLQKGYDSAR